MELAAMAAYNAVFGDDTETPEPRNIGQETAETLAARVRLGPDLARLNYSDTVSTAGANVAALERYLRGWSEPGGEIVGYRSPTGQFIGANDPWLLPVSDTGGYLGGESGRAGVLYNAPGQDAHVLTPVYSEPTKHKGMLQLYGEVAPDIRKVMEESQKWQLDSTSKAISEFGPKYREAVLAANPKLAEALDLMWQDTVEGLRSGTQLSPSEEAGALRSIRSAQAARGLGMGPADAWLEAMSLGEYGNQRKAQRQAQALQLAGVDKSLFGDPFLQLTGRPSGADSAALSLLGSSAGAATAGAPGWFDPFNGYASDLYNTNYNAAWSNVFSKRNEAASNVAGAASLAAAMLGAGSKLAGGF